ncbi:MAG: CPBP family intramembrane metalloprotease [Cellulosilyticum sp.]|nr:CPBP family intramembrane metalloprotease [Cellulosilyticum sp.]
MQYKGEKEQNKKEIVLLIIYALGLSLLADIVILRVLPKVIANISSYFGYELQSSDLLTKYCMGIGVRLVGILIFLYLIKKLEIYKWFTFNVKGRYIAISWLFFVYIIANIEIGDFNEVRGVTVLCMMIEAMAIGFFEEMVFRGTILPLFLRQWGKNKRGIVFAVILSSGIFGIFHLTNLFTAALPIAVFSQVIYASIIGIAFSALLLRTNKNLLWCCLLHGFYDMASGFGDFSKVIEVGQSVSQKVVSITPYLINIGLFIPLLIYGLFLLRKVEIGIVNKIEERV